MRWEAALGAKMGHPDVPVFLFQGDGAYGIGSIAQVMTLARDQIPVIAIITNNYEWGTEKKSQIDYYNDRFLSTNLRENPNFAQNARDMGALGFRVEDYRNVQDVVHEAVVSGKPCVIEWMIEGGEDVSTEPYRRDAFKVTDRMLENYQVRHNTCEHLAENCNQWGVCERLFTHQFFRRNRLTK